MSGRTFLCAVLVALIASIGLVGPAPAAITGDYVEIRSCDVFTGACFANAEMNLTGQEAILSWSVREGSHNGVKLDGLSVIAVVRAKNTLGDVHRFPQPARSVLIVDQSATPQQRAALVAFAKSKAGSLLGETVRVDSAKVSVDSCPECVKAGCVKLSAGDLVKIETRCLGGNDHVCGNEEAFYPPLTNVADARPAFTLTGAFRGTGLDMSFDEANRRSAYLATFND